MLTPLDSVTWSSDLYEGNAAFVEVPGSGSPPSPGTLYVVSQVRPSDNSFVILMSNPVPPDPGPGWSFTQVAQYTFPSLNESFDPVVAYDGSRYIHIIGTQDNRTGLTGSDLSSSQEAIPVDLVKFTFDTHAPSASPPYDGLVGPVVLATASYVREGYDVCPLSTGGSFVVVAVTNPSTVDMIDTVAQVTGVSISGNVLTVTADNDFQPSMVVQFSGIQIAQFLNGQSVTVASSDGWHFTAPYAYPGTYSQSASPPAFESGYATWLPGHSLLGFELSSLDTIMTPPFLLASSPFRSGPVFGSASACSPDGSTVEVYYESHPKDVSFQDQTFTVSQLTLSGILSPPYFSWGPATVLTTFTARYTDNRLTVVPSGTTRTASTVFYTQDPQRNSVVGNVLMGHFDGSISPPVPWSWKVGSGSALGGSILQAVLSLSLTQGASMSYLLSPAYAMRGAWSYGVPTIRPEWQSSYDVNDNVSYVISNYVCIVPVRNRGWWALQAAYSKDDIVAVPVYYIALQGITGNPEALPPAQDTENWRTLRPDEAVPASAPAWDPSESYLAGSAVKVPSFYVSLGIVLSNLPSPPYDPTDWQPLLPPSSDVVHWALSPLAWPLYTGRLDLVGLGIVSPSTYADLSLTWLRGTKSVLDDGTKWVAVGEKSTGEAGQPYYVSHFNVPPTAELSPLGGTVLRGMPFLLDASGTYDPDTGDTVQYTWSLVPQNADIVLSASGPFASLLVSRAIGGAEVPVSVAVAAVDYTGASPNHPPMAVAGASYDFASNTATILSDSADLAIGQQVLLYGLQAAAFLNNAIVTVTSTGTSSSPPSAEFSGTVQFATPAQVLGHDYLLALDSGYAISAPQFVVIQSRPSPPSGLLVPFNAPPVITMPPPPTVQRNSYSTISPSITGDKDADDATTYSWIQIQGTPVQATGTGTASLTFSSGGTMVGGETLEWSLTVDDGVNALVTQSIFVYVVSYDFSAHDSLRLSRSAWPGNIAQRNVPPSLSPLSGWWGPLDVSSVYTDFFSVKRTSILDGTDRYVVISPYSVIVYVEGTPGSVLRKALLPSSTSSPPLPPPLVLDAIHTEDDYTLVLGADGNVYRFGQTLLVETDDPDVVLDLHSLSGLAFSRIFSTVGFAGSRVLVLSGPDGCLLLQVDSSDFSVQGLLEISLSSQRLYGANNVQFVRLANVENLRSGKVLVGTIGTDGSTYETLVNLSQGRIVGTWDKSRLVNQYVTSGEILFEPEDAYSGKPLAPILGTPTDGGANPLMPNLERVNLGWTQTRPDLCSGYVIQSSTDGGATWQLAATVGSGAVENAVLSLARGHAYLFRIQAASGDGSSGYSNAEGISI